MKAAATRRTKLTDQEYNAIATLTMNTKLDSVFDVVDCGEQDKFWDFESEEYMSLYDGIKLLYDGLAYSLYHDGLDDAGAHAIINLFKEFLDETDESLAWLLDRERDEL